MKTKQHTAVARLTKNIIVVDLKKQTGWSRDRIVKAIETMEAENGNLSLRLFEG